MIDYRSHVVAIDGLKASLAAKVFPEPAVSADRDKQIRDVEDKPGLATLGSLIDHLLRHASSDGLELTLLERAASLWSDGLTVYATLGECRSKIEAALMNPDDPASAEEFNNAKENLRLMALNVAGKQDGVEAIRRDVMKLAHIPEHPRQVDRQLDQWGWGDVFLARRTDAFVRTVYSGAVEDTSLRSFAFGVLSGYGANVCGSAYLGQVVGGPRRSHRFRDRVASNVVGSWLSQNNPKAKILASIAKDIRLGDAAATPSLPESLASFIEDSLRRTFNLGRTAPLPDLQTGYARLVRHLELLDAFNTLPPAPTAPADVFLARIYGDPSNPPPPGFTVKAATPQDGPGPGPGNVHPTNHANSNGQPDGSDKAPTTGERCGSFWMAVILGILFLAGGFAPCIGLWVQKKRCKLYDEIIKDWSDANRPSQEQMETLASSSSRLTPEEFKAAAGIDQMNLLVKNMFELQNHVWEGLGKAQTFLATYGLTYPDGMLATPAYVQYLTVPASATLPARAEADPINSYHKYPSTLLENPPDVVGRYPIGTTPDVPIGSTVNGDLPTAARIAGQIWLQIAKGERDSSNLDLDADRGFGAECWAALGSINTDPVGVQPLAYEET